MSQPQPDDRIVYIPCGGTTYMVFLSDVQSALSSAGDRPGNVPCDGIHYSRTRLQDVLDHPEKYA